jgi:hypothetical protein
VGYRLLPWIIEQERGQLLSIHNRWRPHDLLFIQQARATLRDMASRFSHLEQARDELESLPRGERYIKALTRMRIFLRQAGFTWKGDQLVFLRAAAGFYSDYGVVLRLLKEDSDTGKLVSGEGEGV